MNLLRYVTAIISAIKFSIRVEQAMRREPDKCLPPEFFHSHLKRLCAELQQAYDEHYTEDFKLLLLWTPTRR
jgi:hypothetical protein